MENNEKKDVMQDMTQTDQAPKQAANRRKNQKETHA